MATLITLLILLVAVGGAVRYIIKTKKKGAGCIGCPQAGRCMSCSSVQHMEEEMRKAAEERKPAQK